MIFCTETPGVNKIAERESKEKMAQDKGLSIAYILGEERGLINKEARKNRITFRTSRVEIQRSQGKGAS